MSVRSVLVVLNLVALAAIAGFIAFRVLSLRRNPDRAKPLNQSPYLDDQTLEGPKLERSLGAALFFFVIFAAAIPIYWLFLPERDANAERAFDERAIERGAALYADETSPDYDAVVSLLCASCHGADGGGGVAPAVLTSEDPSCTTGDTRPECLPVQASWRAPALDTVLLRFDEEEVRQILVYGRPGTPMPAWGVESGQGVLNAQGISDLIAFLRSIQVSPEEARERSEAAAEELRNAYDPTQQVNALKTAQDNVARAEQALAAAATPDARVRATADLAAARTALANTQAWVDRIRQASDGEVYFLTNCARCHTKYWSVFDPTNPKIPLPAPQGSGAFGPKIDDGATLNQFPDESQHVDFVTKGSQWQVPYGVRGVGSGRMPGMGSMLTEEQIEAIVEYERSL